MPKSDHPFETQRTVKMRMTKWCLILIPLFALGCERTNEGVRCRMWGQNMIRYRDVEILTIEYLNQGVDLRQFPRLRKFVVREAVVSCKDIIYSETIIILNNQICQVNCFL